MRYAKLIKLGGEYIAAEDADYEDYKGFLTCPECGEPVFLRKAHQRKNAHIPDAFVHHKAVPSIELCELRVSKYSTEYIRGKNAESRGQRLAILQANLWSMLKTSNFIQHELKLSPEKEELIYNYVDKNFWHNTNIVQSYIWFIKEIFGGTEGKNRLCNTKSNSAKQINKLYQDNNACLLNFQIMHEAFNLFISPQMRKVQINSLKLALNPHCINSLCKNTSVIENIPSLANNNVFVYKNWISWISKNPSDVEVYLGFFTLNTFRYTNWIFLMTQMENNTEHLKKCLAKQSAGRGFGKTA